MLRLALSLAVLAALPMVLCACSGSNVAAVDWNRPFTPMTGPAPVFLHDVAIANPPYPRDHYVNYEDEPTRFIFRPRNLVTDDTDNGTGGGDQGGEDYGNYDTGEGGEE